ncbi:MAG: DNA cytosine methyltransferase [Sedimentisphaerales bacterium]
MVKRKHKPTIRQSKNRAKISAIDLFCGVGGLTRGLEKAGIDVRLGIDVDPSCKYPYTTNNNATFLLKSVQEVNAEDVESIFAQGHIRLLAGCAPCQTFSTYNQKADSSDQRWWLLLEFSRLVKELSPELVTMENVPGLLDYEIFDQFVENLKNDGYEVTHSVVNCLDYGLPQQRQRLVLLASKLGPIQILAPNKSAKQKTVRNAIADLHPIVAGEVSDKDPMHQSSALSKINLQRIKASKPGGTWRDWNSKLVAKCHKKKSGKTYAGVYGRMVWDEPAPTVTTQFYGFGNGRFGHPEQDRAISLREGAILQSFPKSYKFVRNGEPIHRKTIGRLIGNAVPVKLGEVIGKSIVNHVLEHRKNNGRKVLHKSNGNA